MTSRHSDHNLLIGILALQMDFVDRDALIDAMSAWVMDKSKSLQEVFIARGHIDKDTCELLLALVRKHLEIHGGDPHRSLAALSSVGSSLSEEIKSIADSALDASLTIVGCQRDDDSEGTTTYVQDESRSGPRFRILRPHAKGGLGQVSVALDLELHREVALKELQDQHADHPESRSRFLMEAEVTGCLEHPGIVPVYGLGTYGDGRPYYAMRFVRGDSLKEAVDRFHKTRHAPSRQDFEGVEFRKLLGRFVDVCDAIAYAHSRGVLHRDLKPGNIMLGKYGETLVVDWGLSKLIGADEMKFRSGEPSLHLSSGSGSAPTQMGSVVGTPAFMSPEQAAGNLDELGPASDVYSLGATIYYVLTGKSPIQGDDLGDVLNRIQAGDFAPPRKGHESIPPSLESICLRAMATRPVDRYATPRALAEDVERYLADEPVAAHAEPVSVRMRRWVRKHPRSVTALAATLLVGLASTVVILHVVSGKNQQLAAANTGLDHANLQLVEKNQQLQSANKAERQATESAESKRIAAEEAQERERLAKEESLARRREAESVLAFFQSKVLAAARPENQYGGLGIHATVRAAVDAAEPQIADSFADQPLVAASIRASLASTYQFLGETNLAIDQHRLALQTRAFELGPDHADTLASMNHLGATLVEAGRYAEALPLLQESVDRLRESLGRRHPDTLNALNNLALALRAAGQIDDALAALKEVVRLKEQTLGPGHPDTFRSVGNLADLFLTAGRVTEALTLFEESYQRAIEALGADHPDTLTIFNNLAHALTSAGRAADALPILEEAVKTQADKLGPYHPNTLNARALLAAALEKVGRLDDSLLALDEVWKLAYEYLGPGHPVTLMTANNLAITLAETGQVDAAIARLEEALHTASESVGSDALQTFTLMNSLAHLLSSAGRFGEALAMFETSLERTRAVLAPDHPNTLAAMGGFADALLSAGRAPEAIPILEELLRATEQKLGKDHPDVLELMNKFAIALDDAGRDDEALPVFEATLRKSSELLGPNHRNTLISMNNYAGALSSVGRIDEALSVQQEALRLTRETMGPDHVDTLTSMVNLAGALDRADRMDEALPLNEEAFTRMRESLGPDHVVTFKAMNNLAVAYWKARRLDKSIPLFEELQRRRTARLGRDHPDTLRAVANLGVNYKDAGRAEEAIPLLEEAYRAATRYPSFRATESSLLDAYVLAGKADEAAALAGTLLSARRAKVPPGSPELAVELDRVGLKLLKGTAFTAAEPLFRECLAIREQTLSDSWLIPWSRSTLGAALLGQQKFAEAESLLSAGYEGMNERLSAIPDDEKPRMTEALRRLVSLYELWNKPDEAAKWQAELDKWRETASPGRLDGNRDQGAR